MDSKKRFTEAVDAVLARTPGDNNVSAKTALLMLYDFIVAMATEVGAITEALSIEQCRLLYKIQQTICFTPLRFFIGTLAYDEKLAIRAAAKGELADRGNQAAWADPEVGVISSANLAVMFTESMDLQTNLWTDERITAADMEWMLASRGQSFAPQLRVTNLDSDE